MQVDLIFVVVQRRRLFDLKLAYERSPRFDPLELFLDHSLAILLVSQILQVQVLGAFDVSVQVIYPCIEGEAWPAAGVVLRHLVPLIIVLVPIVDRGAPVVGVWHIVIGEESSRPRTL